MKRLTAFLLMLTLLGASALASSAAPADRLERRMAEQYLKSGFYADLTVDIKGAEMEYIDAATWAAMNLLLPGTALSYESTIRRDDRETTISLARGDAELLKATILENGLLTLFKSDLLSDRDAWYAAPSTYDFVDLIARLQGGESSAWPPLAGAVLAVAGAPEEWQSRAGVYMNAYLTELGLWMQRFSSVALVRAEDKTTLTEMTCVISASEVKKELQSMLTRLYADNALLTLLREVLSADESAAYLNPLALPSLLSMVEALELEGDVTIGRRFNAQGAAIYWRISLPFTPSQAISRLTIAAAAGERGEEYDIEIMFNEASAVLPGAKIALNAVPDDEGAYAGELLLTLPTAADAYTVAENSTREIAYTFYFYYDAPAQTYDFETDRASRIIDAVLALTPAQGYDGHRHSFTFHADLTSRASNTTPTRLNASLSLMDLTTDSGLTVNLAARTAVAWTPETLISSVPDAGVTRLDQLTEEQMTAMIAKWRQDLTSAPGRVAAQLMPYTVTDDDVSAP